MSFTNMKIGQRLALGFSVLSLLMIVIVSLSITMLSRVNQSTTQIVQDELPKVELAYQLNLQVNEIALALRNMLLVDSPHDVEIKKQKELVLAGRKTASEYLSKLGTGGTDAKLQAIVAKLGQVNGKYSDGQDQLMRLIEAGVGDDARAFLRNELRPILLSYKQALDELVKLEQEAIQGAGSNAQSTFENTRVLMLGLGAGMLAFAAFVGFWITRSVTRPVQEALRVANTVAAGDLTSRIDVRSRDEMGQLLTALRAMNESLVRTVSEVKTGTDAMASAAAEIAGGNHDLSARTEQQASSLEETASSMEELTSTVKQNADNARQANTLAEAASGVASKGGEVIAKVVGTMDEINASAKKIADITGVIDGIAFQTNILALNAAVEAARAGEQGRGFAVVATEVRSLAQRSAAAAKEIKALIGDSVEKVETGSRLVNDAGATMQEIVDSVHRVTDIMAEISAASAEQTSGIEQVNQAISQMDQVTQQNAALVEEAAAASQSMQDQAAKLAHVVGMFRLDGAQAAGMLPAAPRAARPAPARGTGTALAPTSRAPAGKPHATAGSAGGEWEEF